MCTSGIRTAWVLSLVLLLGSALLLVPGDAVATAGDTLEHALRELSWWLLAAAPEPTPAPPITLGLRN